MGSFPRAKNAYPRCPCLAARPIRCTSRLIGIVDEITPSTFPTSIPNSNVGVQDIADSLSSLNNFSTDRL